MNESEIPNNYNLPLALYDLYKGYDTEQDWQQALYQLTKLIKENKPLSQVRESQLEAESKLF